MREKEAEIALLESKQIIEKNTKKSILIGAISLMLFAGVSIAQLRAKNAKTRKFFEAEKALDQEKFNNSQLKEKTLEAELENKRLKEEQLHVELELRSKELTAKALHIIQKNKLLRELKGQINVLQKDSTDQGQTKELKKVAGMIDYGFHFDKDWEEFESTFDQVHTDFFERLKARFPNLTSAELRLCSLVRLNLNSKDMATILAISKDSLRIARYRLRKKLALQQGENLTSFIVNL